MRRSECANAIRGTGQTLQWVSTDAGAWFVQHWIDNTAHVAG